MDDLVCKDYGRQIGDECLRIYYCGGDAKRGSAKS
jgi:hypothetical protein